MAQLDAHANYYKPRSLREALERLGPDIGATTQEIEPTEGLKREGITALRIDVQDERLWATERAAENLLPYLGEAAWHAYTARDEDRSYDPNDMDIRTEALYSIFEAGHCYERRCGHSSTTSRRRPVL